MTELSKPAIVVPALFTQPSAMVAFPKSERGQQSPPPPCRLPHYGHRLVQERDIRVGTSCQDFQARQFEKRCLQTLQRQTLVVSAVTATVQRSLKSHVESPTKFKNTAKWARAFCHVSKTMYSLALK